MESPMLELSVIAIGVVILMAVSAAIFNTAFNEMKLHKKEFTSF